MKKSAKEVFPCSTVFEYFILEMISASKIVSEHCYYSIVSWKLLEEIHYFHGLSMANYTVKC